MVKLANQYVDNLRRYEYAKKSFEGKNVLKGSRYLLLKNPENLNEDRKEPERLLGFWS
jgi:hypothetical protein